MCARSYESWVAPALLALLTAAAFANAVPNGFVWIDHWQVESGGMIARSLPEFWSAWRQPLGSIPGWTGPAPYARPVAIAAFSLVHALAGPNAAAFHLLLVVLHVANALLAYSILAALTASVPTAFFAAGLFALHPLQTAAVSWVSGIADPLFACFVLLAFRLQLSAERRPRWRFLLRTMAVVSFALALGAKETAMVFPLLLGTAYLLFPLGTEPVTQRARANWRHLAGVLAPFFLLMLLDLVYRHWVLGGAAMGAGWGAIPLATRLWTAPRLVMSYLTLPFRFAALTVCDDYALSASFAATSRPALLGVIALFAGTVVALRRWPQLAFASLWLLLSLLPALNLVPILHYRADRFFYFPMIGWSLGIATIAGGIAAALVQGRPQLWRAGTVVAAAVLTLLLVFTIKRNGLFADDRTLFEATVQTSPFCREAHTSLGDAYLRAGRNDDAAQQYELALTAEPDRASYVVLPKVFINLGMAQLGRRQYAAAADAFREAHQLQPGLLHPIFGLGIANLALGRIADGVGWLEQAYAMDAGDPDVSFNLALGYDHLGKAQEAVAMYRHYLTIAPRGRARALAEERLQKLLTE